MDKLKRVFADHFELTIWSTAMFLLAINDPNNTPHFELCPLKLLGIHWCPGCGLGQSISYLFHGQVSASLHAHWLGIPAVILILRRICFLLPVSLLLKKLRPHAH